MLTRPQFDAACKALIDKYAEPTEDFVATSSLKGWSWNEHPSYPNFGYMSRTVNVFRRLGDPADHLNDICIDATFDELDPSVASTNPEPNVALLCQQHVVFSSTFRVPAFYFIVYDSSGAPLALSDIVKTSLFKSRVSDGVEVSSYAVSLPTSTFPLLSHGDHPTLGTPCWYFHPCETATAVGELLHEAKEDGGDEQAKWIRWLELWFMVVCSVINL